MMSKIHILLLIVYVFAPFLHSEGSTSVHPTLSNICKKTGNPDLCISSIAPGFNGREADATSALKEAIRVITTRFEEASKFADKLVHEATTPRSMIGNLKLCKDSFDAGLGSLPDIPRAIDDRSDPNGLNLAISGIETSADTCLSPIDGGSIEKSPLHPVASKLSELARICMDISTQLGKSGDAAHGKPNHTATGSSSSSKAKGTAAQVHPTLSNICKDTRDADLCISTIAPGLDGREADASSALKEAIRVATPRFEEAKKLADKLAQEPNTPSTMVGALNECSDKFDQGVGRLEQALRGLDRPSESKELSYRLAAVVALAHNCITTLHEQHNVKSPLDPVASELTKLSEICGDIGGKIPE